MAQYKPVLFLVAAIVAIVGFLGLMDLGNVPYAGFFRGPDNDVMRVFPGSAAEKAGLAPGDVIESIGGISITDTKALARRERPAVGEARTFVVTHDGMRREIELVYEKLSPPLLLASLAYAVTGFCFLLFPLWAFHRVPSASTLILALFGLCFAVAFIPAPYSPSYFLRTLGGAISTSAVILGFAFLVHYLMAFPAPRRFLSKVWASTAMYAPAIALALFFLFMTVAQPDATGSFNRIVGVLVGVFIVSFFGWALVAMIRRFRKSSFDERRQHGLNLMLGGTLLGLLPVTVSNLIGALAPQAQANLPGVRFYALTLVLIPLSFSIAALRSARSESRRAG